jgi:hypothetical protein
MLGGDRKFLSELICMYRPDVVVLLLESLFEKGHQDPITFLAIAEAQEKLHLVTFYLGL